MKVFFKEQIANDFVYILCANGASKLKLISNFYYRSNFFFFSFYSLEAKSLSQRRQADGKRGLLMRVTFLCIFVFGKNYDTIL